MGEYRKDNREHYDKSYPLNMLFADIKVLETIKELVDNLLARLKARLEELNKKEQE